jgi:chloramphenicol 3-O-phosphotransferase
LTISLPQACDRSNASTVASSGGTTSGLSSSKGCLAALVQGGNTLVSFVGVHCALPELERRAIARGHRKLGEARADYEVTHTFGAYDVEVDTASEQPDEIAATLMEAWETRQRPSALERMAAHEQRV